MDSYDVSLGLSLDALIYIKGIVNLKQMIVGLIFKFRGACIYTWLNVNLYTCCYALHFLLFTDYYNFSGNIVIVFILS